MVFPINFLPYPQKALYCARRMIYKIKMRNASACQKAANDGDFSAHMLVCANLAIILVAILIPA